MSIGIEWLLVTLIAVIVALFSVFMYIQPTTPKVVKISA